MVEYVILVMAVLIGTVWVSVPAAEVSITVLFGKTVIVPVAVIVPQPPGDPCDTFARMLGHHMGERLGQQHWSSIIDPAPVARSACH